MGKAAQGCGKGSKGNMLKAPYKDRPSKGVLQIRNEKPFHYKNPNESLFYKERITKVKTTMILGGERKQKMKADKKRREGWQKEIVRCVGKSMKQSKKIRWEMKKVIKDA